MSIFGSKGGPISRPPVVETNPYSSKRPIIWIYRHLHGLQGAYSRYNFKMLDALHIESKGAPQVILMHWGVQIGPYLYELWTDTGGNGFFGWNRISWDRKEFWRSEDYPDRTVGETTATDKEIEAMAIATEGDMRSGNPSYSVSGKYHPSKNSCHTFVLDLVARLLRHGNVEHVDSESPVFKDWRMMYNCALKNYLSLVKRNVSSPAAYAKSAKSLLSGNVRRDYFGGF